MVEVIFNTKNGKITGFVSKGHSGYAARGQDIVCAGISALTYQTALGIIEILKLEPSYSEKDGFFSIDMSKTDLQGKEKEVSVLLESMRLVVAQISEQYPKNVKFIEKEEKEC